ncbi:unnamed protein product, partial [Scytosiphon promiscuus]
MFVRCFLLVLTFFCLRTRDVKRSHAVCHLFVGITLLIEISDECQHRDEVRGRTAPRRHSLNHECLTRSMAFSPNVTALFPQSLRVIRSSRNKVEVCADQSLLLPEIAAV